MTLLASERSILIRNKFRSVLQLRIQNRRQQNEINADSALKGSCPPKPGVKDASEAVRQTDDGATQKMPPSGHTAETAQDRGVGGAQRHKRARLADDLTEKIHLRHSPLELRNKNILPLENTPGSFPVASDVFEDDISCSCSSTSSSPEQLGMHQSPAFSLSPGLTSDQSLGDLSPVNTPLNHSPSQCSLALLPATESINQPMTMTVGETNSMATTGRSKGIYMTSQTTPLLPKTASQLVPPAHSTPGASLASARPPRPRKPRDSKPKMRELKYHQYIPPDQRGGAGSSSSSNSAQKSAAAAAAAQPIDPAYSRLLQQQQVFLQLQILNQQQRLTVATSGDSQLVRLSGAPQQTQPSASPPKSSVPVDTSPPQKPERLPPNLDDLTVSELRQQLRKRGLPVSGTKPALLERLRHYQPPVPPRPPPAPLRQLTPTLDSGNSNSSSSSSSSPANPTPEPPPANPGHVYIQAPGVVASLPDSGLSTVGFLASGTPPSGPSSSPGLQASSPLSGAAPWRSEQAAEELSVELKMRERMRNRPRDRLRELSSEACGASLHPFLQQEPGCSRGRADQEGPAEALFPQVFCSQPCDVIGQDFELPRQITASPVQSSSSVRSLEEELQEAIQRVQMDPSQSIDDILEGTIGHSGDASPVAEIQSPVNVLARSSPLPPPSDQSQAAQGQCRDDNFLSSPLCSSLLLELPPSPSSTLLQAPAPPPPPPPPICTTPPPSTNSRKRREVATFDPADWLESLTSGFRPLTPPQAPFRETDFGLDSDLNVNRVLDLMVEQW
ncbi:myocardin [Sardina pilchardus]|uniref:myocardin n=1 Tax=Sardina pilchardus TaxID=27697 RepID=UPI002E0E439D